MPDIICMGELLVDFVATERNVGLAEVTQYNSAAGGAPANVSVGLQQLGCTAAFVGKVGDDPFGKRLQNTLIAAGVDTSLLFFANDEDKTDDEAARTTINFAAIWDDGHKELCFYRGADRHLLAQDITPAPFDDARCFHYGSITFIAEPAATAQHKALKMARDRGLMVTYDPNYRPTLWSDERTAHRVIKDGKSEQRGI